MIERLIAWRRRKTDAAFDAGYDHGEGDGWERGSREGYALGVKQGKVQGADEMKWDIYGLLSDWAETPEQFEDMREAIEAGLKAAK